MWSSSLIISVLLAARLGAAQQLAFPVQAPANIGIGTSSPTQLDSPLETGNEASTFAETLVSALSASTQHTTFLHLLQRAKCIPLLAHIGNATVFAPTDTAWDAWAERNRPSDQDGDDQSTLVAGWLGPKRLAEWKEDEDDVIRARMAEGGDEDEQRRVMDNQNWALRQHLLYHMLNYTLLPYELLSNESSHNVSIQTTLLYPLAEEPPLPPVPEPGAPWIPHGGEGMLGGQGQKVRFARIGSEEGGERGRVGVDWLGEGGVGLWDGSGWERQNETLEDGEEMKRDRGNKGHEGEEVIGAKWVRNGVIVGIDGVLDTPPSIEEIIKTHPSLSHLSSLLPYDSLPSPLPSSLRTTPHLTVFAPTNEAFDVLDEIERRYLDSPFGEEGVGRIVGGQLVLGVGKGRVGWSKTFSRKTEQAVNTSSSNLLQVQRFDNGSLLVNGTEATTVDLFASNGVVHLVPSLLLPESFTLLNSAEKTLLSLNATRFVSLLRSAGLSDRYIGERGKHAKNDEEAYTILAPTDEVLDMLERGSMVGRPLPLAWLGAADFIRSVSGAHEDEDTPLLSISPVKDSSPLASLLQYHILPGRLLPTDIKDGMLLGTELKTSALDGGRQRLLVEESERPGRDRNDWETIGQGEIRFGGATVLGKPVKSGKSIIYLISNLLSPPDDVLQTAVSDLQLSTFIAAAYAAGLDKVVKHTPATTYFMPRNRAFSQLGLTMKYLLLPEGKDELRKVVKYHAVNEVVYANDVEVGKEKLTTLQGGQVILQRTVGLNHTSTLGLRSPSKWEGYDSGTSLPANGELRPAKIIRSDALTETGVIHTLDAVVLPADVRITNAKLIRGSKQGTMMDLMVRAGLGWVLEGREPSKDEVQRTQLDGMVRPQVADGGDDDESGGTDDGEDGRDEIAWPSYTVLVPTDKAFSRLNLTHYLSNSDALLDLLKLHIIPSTQPNRNSDYAKRSLNQKQDTAVPGPKDGQPLLMDDDAVYTTLLSSGGNKYGELAFRATGDNSYIVGIRNARGSNAGEWARIGQSGRGSVRWRRSRSTAAAAAAFKGGKARKGKGEGRDDAWDRLLAGGMTLGGGVMMLDAVLVPYQPSWWSRWGWLLLVLSGLAVILLIAAISVGWWYMTREKKGYAYEAVDGEDGTLEGENDE